ncbi:MAG: saccharopine dehydrogenase, partial [Bacteroidia bacterium]
MKKIVVFGAGLSATYLIKSLEDNAQACGWELTIIDRDVELAKSKCHLPNTVCIELDINDNEKVAA